MTVRLAIICADTEAFFDAAMTPFGYFIFQASAFPVTVSTLTTTLTDITAISVFGSYNLQFAFTVTLAVVNILVKRRARAFTSRTSVIVSHPRRHHPPVCFTICFTDFTVECRAGTLARTSGMLVVSLEFLPHGFAFLCTQGLAVCCTFR